MSVVRSDGRKHDLPRVPPSWQEIVDEYERAEPEKLVWFAALSLRSLGWSYRRIAAALNVANGHASRAVRALERELIDRFGRCAVDDPASNTPPWIPPLGKT